MSVTGLALAQHDDCLRQIERIAASHVLHGSESLCKLLRYLATQTLDHPGTAVKEFKIATEVFGRPTNFDPRVDSTVRVQTGRLRSKLGEYYSVAGADDPVLVEIPRGSYSLTFQVRGPAAAPPSPALDLVPAAVHAEPTPGRVWPGMVGTLGLLLAGSLILLAYVLLREKPAAAPLRGAQDEAVAFRRFWGSFIDGTDEPWVVFSNAEFFGRPETGMRYFNPASDDRSQILDHYTGVGEVLGVHELDRVFSIVGHGLRVKRGRLLSLDDAKNNDLIFVGSPSENLPLRELPSTQEFVFQRTGGPERKGDLAIVNVHPRPGESKAYFASASRPLTEDYSIIAMVPGLNQTRWAMILAGITTIGTQAAVEYVCRAGNVEELLKRLTASKTAGLVPFEAVLQVKVSSGVPVHSELAAVRAIR